MLKQKAEARGDVYDFDKEMDRIQKMEEKSFSEQYL